MIFNIVVFLIFLGLFCCIIVAIDVILKGVIKKEWNMKRLIKSFVLIFTCILISNLLISECNKYKVNIKEDGREQVQKVKLEGFNKGKIYIFESYDGKVYYSYNGGYSSNAIPVDDTKIIEVGEGAEPLLIEYSIKHKNNNSNWLYKILGFNTFDYETKGYEIHIQKSGIIKGTIKE
ncbi:MAG: hypothetical protein PHD20_03370 [Clostridia bacterium]|nr:hypothetical protein [Clostridia bacterium]MDD2627907.1 hypothetical protein [Clostridia bacterium]